MSSNESTVAPTPDTDASRRRPRLLLLFAAVAAASIAVDAISKTLVVGSIEPGQPVRLLGGAVYLSLTRNSGAAFSMASDFTWALSLLAIAVVTALVWWAFLRLGSVGWAIALGMIAGGALGNLIDRFFREPGFLHGHVVDFISVFDPAGGYFAIFNLADSCLVIGVGLVILMELRGRRIDGSRYTKESEKDGAGES